ncbi:TPA: hypothetical protein TY884_002194 [Streptococcus suis]|uniref:hypothetical protein n=1 Tax=Streptococcus suis TaxID=1307 RepID=UPI000AC52161|nr:hypothetical protein [Streptococcus suis]WNF58939.1 hypothetical protein RJW50_06695 [Streptococcus suis]HEL1699405.1 hypothetical protein [Streptococcus suis]HEL1705002.1 hypothetical protein [Streptococcus suis]HEL1764658.1 hypothetical protein [Streptococcus suis]HEL1793043.1 hypothetical protein [Streptococcus suis]
MTTFKEINEQVAVLKSQFEVFDRFDNEIDKVKSEIATLQNKGSEIQSFEDFQTIDAKQKYLLDLQKQRKKLEVSKINEIAAQARKINVRGYLSSELEHTGTIISQRQLIKSKSIELLELIANYNDTYKRTALELASKVGDTGISEIFDRINQSDEYNRTNTQYLHDGITGYDGERSKYLDESDSIAYLINRINVFEDSN